MAIAQLAFSLFLYALGGVVVGVSLFPGLLLTWTMWEAAAGAHPAVRVLAGAIGLGCTYFIYGFFLLGVTAALFQAMRLRLEPGEHPLMSVTTFKWVLGSALHLVVKVTFIDFLMLSPFLNAWLRAMGAQLGSNVMINSKYVHDVSLLEIGDDSVIGGEAAISCHAVEHGKLILRKIRIGRKCLIGQRSILMPGVTVEDGAVVGAQAVVLKNDTIPAGETWVGIPAAKMQHHPKT